jgi:hypothetical protein
VRAGLRFSGACEFKNPNIMVTVCSFCRKALKISSCTCFNWSSGSTAALDSDRRLKLRKLTLDDGSARVSTSDCWLLPNDLVTSDMLLMDSRISDGCLFASISLPIPLSLMWPPLKSPAPSPCAIKDFCTADKRLSTLRRCSDGTYTLRSGPSLRLACSSTFRSAGTPR